MTRSLLLFAAVAPAHLAAQPVPQTSAAFDRPISWARLIPNAASDQKDIWLFPRKLRRKNILIPTLAMVGVTAGLVALDPRTAPYFRNTSSFDGFNHAFTGIGTTYGIVAAPVAFYTAGLIRKDSKMQRTALLAAEAIGDVEILTTVMKDVDRRLRPIAVQGSFADTWFADHSNSFHAVGSFPSGHTIAAFAVATVVARRYGNHRWVPYVAYGLAAAVGFSRITLSSHYVSDVFMGGALGYSITRFAVLRQ
ncbi:MAG: phosphatase PAP2 family protein [Bryobacteraceae bacterium]